MDIDNHPPFLADSGIASDKQRNETANSRTHVISELPSVRARGKRRGTFDDPVSGFSQHGCSFVLAGLPPSEELLVELRQESRRFACSHERRPSGPRSSMVKTHFLSAAGLLVERTNQVAFGPLGRPAG